MQAIDQNFAAALLDFMCDQPPALGIDRLKAAAGAMFAPQRLLAFGNQPVAEGIAAFVSAGKTPEYYLVDDLTRVENGLFDLVYLHHQAEFAGLQSVLHKAFRLLKPNGLLWVDGYDVDPILRRVIDEFILGTQFQHFYVCLGPGHVIIQNLKL